MHRRTLGRVWMCGVSVVLSGILAGCAGESEPEAGGLEDVQTIDQTQEVGVIESEVPQGSDDLPAVDESPGEEDVPPEGEEPLPEDEGTPPLDDGMPPEEEEAPGDDDEPPAQEDDAPAEPLGLDRPVGIYSLDTVVDQPFVDGVVMRLAWSSAEPVEGQYDFERFADVVRQADALGQSVTLANLVLRAPDWLLNEVETFENGSDLRAVPWDEDGLAAMARYAEALANFEIDGIAVKDHPAIKQVTAPIHGLNSLRLLRLPQGYTPALLEQAVIDSVQIWADRFPSGKHLYVGLFGVADEEFLGVSGQSDVTEMAIREALLQRFDGVSQPRINFFQEFLTGKVPEFGSQGFRLMNEVSEVTGLMYQACGAWTEQDGAWAQCNWVEPLDTPDGGINHGFANVGATYFEIYPVDLQNEAYFSQFEHWSELLRALTVPQAR